LICWDACWEEEGINNDFGWNSNAYLH
jgi:hypothetical protein